MSEIKDLKEQLKKTELLYQMAAEMSQFKAGFLARTAHELRSPLSSLIGLHQLILSDLCDNPEEGKEFISQAYELAKKVVTIINQIVEVSKIDHGSKTEKQLIELNTFFSQIYNLTYLQAFNRNLHLKVIGYPENIYLETDSNCLRQLLLILLDIGISHIETGEIQLSLDKLEDSNKILIYLDLPSSLSLGSEPINLLQTEPISEVTKETIRQFSQKLVLSPGMKLLLCQNLLEVMNGRLEITSRDNFTQLKCFLPLKKIPENLD